MKLQAFFFDFDGVLADSVEVKTRAFAKMFEPYGRKIQNKVVEHHLNHGGMNRFDKFRYYYKNFLQQPLSDNELDGLCQKFAGLVVEDVVNSPEIPGSILFLAKCTSIAPCFIVSATPENEILEIARRRNLSGFFEGILGAPASKGENVLKIIEEYNLAPEKCIFFGDAESDFLAAQKNNLSFIGIVEGPDAPLLKFHPEIQWFQNFLELEKTNFLEVYK